MQNVPEWLQTMDETVLRWIGEHLRVPALDGLVSGFTGLGDAGALFIILAVILLLFRTTRRGGGDCTDRHDLWPDRHQPDH